MEPKHFESLYPETSREAEIAQIVSYIREGNFSQLIGLPGVGREQVFSLLTSNKDVRRKHLGEDEKTYHFVLVDFEELQKKPIAEVMKLLFLELSDSLRDRAYEAENIFVKNELDTVLAHNDATLLLQALKRSIEYLTKERGLHVVFLFDRFEDYIPSVSDEFFVSLHSLRNRSDGKFSVVFALTRPLEHSIEPEYFKDAFDLLAGNRVFMKLYDDATITSEIFQIEGTHNTKISEEVKKEVLRLTGGHRRMVITAFEELIRNTEQNGKILLFDQNDRIETLLLESLALRNISYQLWNSFRPQEQLLLKRQVQHEGESISENEDEEKRIQYLRDLGLLSNNRFAIPLFASFVRYRLEHNLDEKLIYKPDSKQVFIGERDITDTFTSSEKRALLFLLGSQGKVVSRDDLIAAVWKDVSTTEGVTDQAIDQLIYRIRRKIETDFSNPKHLQTVKGMGFKFVLN